jgi:hypothetical protein
MMIAKNMCRTASVQSKGNRFAKVLLLVFMLLVVFPSCKGEPEVYIPGPDPMDQWFDPTLPQEGVLIFTALPVDEAMLAKVYPLGLMGSHTFPTDHIYIAYLSPIDPDTQALQEVPVLAPAAGRILYIEQAGPPYNDNSVHISISNSISYVLGHLHMDDTLKVGDLVEAGDRLGKCVNGSNLDVLVLDKSNGKNSCDNEKYPFTNSYAQNPFDYFTQDLRTTLYGKIVPHVPAQSIEAVTMDDQPEHDSSLDGEHTQAYLDNISQEHGIYDDTGDGRKDAFARHYAGLAPAFKAVDGTFEYDVPGTLQGNWFVQGDNGLWLEGIAFAYDAWYPAQSRISCSQPFDLPDYPSGRYAIRKDQSGYVAFDEITVGETATYTLYDPEEINWHGVAYGTALGLLKVELIDSTTVKVESFSDITLTDPSFTQKARLYHR